MSKKIYNFVMCATCFIGMFGLMNPAPGPLHNGLYTLHFVFSFFGGWFLMAFIRSFWNSREL